MLILLTIIFHFPLNFKIKRNFIRNFIRNINIPPFKLSSERFKLLSLILSSTQLPHQLVYKYHPPSTVPPSRPYHSSSPGGLLSVSRPWNGITLIAVIGASCLAFKTFPLLGRGRAAAAASLSSTWILCCAGWKTQLTATAAAAVAMPRITQEEIDGRSVSVESHKSSHLLPLPKVRHPG